MSKYLSKIVKGGDTIYIKDSEARKAIGENAAVGYVDLGLPSGTLWAICNVGATEEAEYGNYYMYGKGATQYNYGDTVYSGTEDPLAAAADTATVTYGTPWHMPTKDQINELFNNTTYSWVANFNGSGVKGGKFTARNGKYIFFPAAGYMSEGTLSQAGTTCKLWTSTPVSSNTSRASQLSRLGYFSDSPERQEGYSIRAVCDSVPLNKLSDKADKVSNATANNFAGLDSSGNLKDSGSKASDFATANHTHTNKADKVSGATNNNLAALNSNGNLKDSGYAASDFAAASDLADEVTRATTAEETLTTSVEELQQLYEGLTQSDIIVGPKPTTGEANKIYRVPGSNSYTDWMYYNGQWVEMATYGSGVDFLPTEDSRNYVYSGGVYEWGAEASEIVTTTFDDWDPGDAEAYFESLQNEITLLSNVVNTAQLAIGAVQTDLVPTQNSANFVNSGVVYTSLQVKYEKPSGGIPSTDMTSAVQTSLELADNSVQFGELVDTIQ